MTTGLRHQVSVIMRIGGWCHPVLLDHGNSRYRAVHGLSAVMRNPAVARDDAMITESSCAPVRYGEHSDIGRTGNHP
jgi:hypothetical protein